jgi:mRNA interferase HigB
VRIVGNEKIAKFSRDHSTANNALAGWMTVVEGAAWKNPAELKRTFGNASFVGDQTVFNIGGNKFRLIALVRYRLQIVLVQYVLTHKEYDKGGWKL